jgi:hypothetical protein
MQGSHRAGGPMLGPETNDENSGTSWNDGAAAGTHILVACLLASPASIAMWYPETTQSCPNTFYFLWYVLVNVLLLWRDTMTTATLIRKAFSWGWLRVQRFSSLSSWQEAWQHADRSIWIHMQQAERDTRLGLSFETLKPTPSASNRAIPTPTGPHS